MPQPARDWIEIPHLLIHIFAFLIWTYDIRTVIWSGVFEYDPLVVLVLTAAFAVFAVLDQPDNQQGGRRTVWSGIVTPRNARCRCGRLDGRACAWPGANSLTANR